MTQYPPSSRTGRFFIQVHLLYLQKPNIYGNIRDASEQDFQVLMKLYLTEYLRSNANNPHPKSEVYQFRGILAHLSQIYYERSMHKRDLGLQDRHLEHVYREYLRTIDEDIRYLNETENETLDNLMLEIGISLPGFRKPTVARDLFNTNTIHILSKIDPNIAQLWKSIEQ